MKNPYQLTGYFSNGKSVLLGTFNTYTEAVDNQAHRQADPLNVYTVFKVSKVYQWQVTVLKRNGKIDFCGYYATKTQADNAYSKWAKEHSKVAMEFIGGIGDE